MHETKSHGMLWGHVMQQTREDKADLGLLSDGAKVGGRDSWEV